MVKTMSNNVSSSSADEAKNQRKKQAKREAKAMLAVEQARQDVQKAEQKIAKFQARLEARIARLRTLEAKLTRIRTSPQEPETATTNGGVDGHQEQSEPAQEAVGASAGDSQPFTITEEDEGATGAPVPASPVNTTAPTDQEVSLPPAEGRADILQNQETASDTSTLLPDEDVGSPQQKVIPSESEGDASSFDTTDTETARPTDESGEETLDAEDNFRWWSGSKNETTPANNATDSRSDSEKTETRKGLGDTTRRLGQRLTAEEESEWQPEEDASQRTESGNGD